MDMFLLGVAFVAIPVLAVCGLWGVFSMLSEESTVIVIEETVYESQKKRA